MKPKFNIDNYRHYEVPVCVLCETKKESDNFCKYMDSIGIRLKNGIRYTEIDNYWYRYNYRGKICYYFLNGKIGSPNIRYKSDLLCLIYSDFDWDNKKCKFMEVKNETKI